MSSNYSGRTTPRREAEKNTRGPPPDRRLTFPSRSQSNTKKKKNIAEERSIPTTTNWNTGGGTTVSPMPSLSPTPPRGTSLSPQKPLRPYGQPKNPCPNQGGFKTKKPASPLTSPKKPKQTPRIRRRAIWTLGSSWKFRTIDGG